MNTKRNYSTTEALAYLGIKRRSFETHILPRLTGTRIGTSVVYDIADLDAAWESYKLDAGSKRPAVKGELWDAQKQRAYTGRRPAMTLTKSTKASAFDNAVLRVLSKPKAG